MCLGGAKSAPTKATAQPLIESWVRRQFCIWRAPANLFSAQTGYTIYLNLKFSCSTLPAHHSGWCQPTGQVLTGVQGALCRNLTSSMTSARTLATSGWSAISSQMLLLYPHAWPCGPRAPTSLVGGPANGGAAASHLPIQRLRCHRSSFGGARYRFELQSSSTSYTRTSLCPKPHALHGASWLPQLPRTGT